MKEAKTSPPTNIKPNLLKTSQKSFLITLLSFFFLGFRWELAYWHAEQEQIEHATTISRQNLQQSYLYTIFVFLVFPRDYNSLAVIMYKSSRMNRENVTEITQLTRLLPRGRLAPLCCLFLLSSDRL